jgi:predicted oxidoreductase
MENFTIRTTTDQISTQEIDDLMVTAFEGGINYWCDYAEIIDKPETECTFKNEVISRNGSLKLYDAESDDTWILTREKFLKGVEKALNHFHCDFNKNPLYATVQEMVENHDVETVDVIIQYALFDEVVFG